MSTDVPAGDVALYLYWKQTSEVVRARVLGDVLHHIDLTEPELTVLVHLDNAAGAMRQNALAAAAGWDRTRLSHLLSRMQERGYLTRERLRNGVLVTTLDAGAAALTATRTPLSAAVAKHVTPRLDDDLRAALRAIADAFA